MREYEKVKQTLFALLKGGSRLRPSTAIDKISKHQHCRGLTRLVICDQLRKLVSERLIEGVTPNGLVVGMVGWVIPPEEDTDPDKATWNEALVTAGFEGLYLDAIEQAYASVIDFSSPDLKSLACGLREIIKHKDEMIGFDPYEVTAKFLLGSAKLWKVFKKPLEACGVSLDESARASYVVVAGPANPENVLLIENLASFESAVRVGLSEQSLLVSIYGHSIAWGNLIERLSSQNLIPLIRCGQPPNLGMAMDRNPVFFWGDLDLGGLGIFARIHKHYPQAKLSALYEPMVDCLRNGGGHPYVKAVDKEGQQCLTLPQLDDPYWQTLLSLCKVRGVDQEIVTLDEMRRIMATLLPSGTKPGL